MAALRQKQPHGERSEEHTSELQSRRYLHSFPTRRSSDLHPVKTLRSFRSRSSSRTDAAYVWNGRFAPKAAAWRGFALTPRKARRITPDPKVRSLGSLKSLKSPTRRWICYENRAPKYTP